MSVFLIVGSTGAGKTTYSQKLSQKVAASVFSIDDWMKALYWPDMPAQPDYSWFVANGEWYAERIARCERLILRNAMDRAKRGENTILDLGFSTADHRIQFITHFKENGIPVEIHYLNPPADLRWQRVQKRNQEKGETFVMEVDRKMFDFVETIFEAPQETEGALIREIR